MQYLKLQSVVFSEIEGKLHIGNFSQQQTRKSKLCCTTTIVLNITRFCGIINVLSDNRNVIFGLFVINISFLFYSAVLSILWFGNPAKGATVSPVDGHGSPGDTSQGAVLSVVLPTTCANLPHDGLSQ